MYAVISDIHSNLEALNAALAEIDRRGITEVFCLGDVIGYGPNPIECLDLVRARCRFSLMGNHDFAVVYEPYNFNTGAEAASFWTRRQFEQDGDDARRADRWRYLGNLPVRYKEAERRLTLVHASPRRPINEYIFPDDIYTNPGKVPAIFERFEMSCYVGHTHVPGVFLQGPDFYSPDELDDFRFQLGSEKAVINVGSIGQPRDRDPRCSFVIVDDTGSLEFIRLEYDINAVVKKVEQIDALDNFLGTRLLDGR